MFKIKKLLLILMFWQGQKAMMDGHLFSSVDYVYE